MNTMKLRQLLSMQVALVSVSVLFSALPVAAQATQVAARVTQPVDIEDVVPLRGHTHPLTRPEHDRGPAPDSLPMSPMLLILERGRDQKAELRQLLDEQQVKSSPNYHQWLTPEQFGKRFGPADSDIQAVTDWLTTQGFEVNRVGAGRTVIEFSGTAGLVRHALHTEIHKFAVQGEEHWATASDPRIPAALRARGGWHRFLEQLPEEVLAPPGRDFFAVESHGRGAASPNGYVRPRSGLLSRCARRLHNHLQCAAALPDGH